MEQHMVANRGEEDQLIELPPGFRFHPTDEEIITSYLTEKVIDSSFVAIAIGEADLNKCEPWDLPKKAKMGEKEWYFFCQRDRKYPTGMRTNRATESGYWKATGKDKEIFNNKGKSGCLVGMKKTLVFYRGRAPKGEKTNWVMHEYRLEGKISQYTNLSKAAKDEWVVCRVFHKNMGLKKTPTRMNSFGDHDLLDYSSLPPLMDPTSFNNNIMNNNDNKACGYGDHDVKPGTNLASTAPSLSSAKASSSDDHHAINNNNYLSYFSIGGSGGQVQKPNFSFQVQPTSSYYQATSLSNPNMLYPHHHQFQNPNPNPNPNPSSFWFQPNPNNSDYFQQGMIRVTNNTASDHDEDDQAMLRAIAAANNNNNNNNSNMNNETSSSAAAGFGSSGGLERQCKVEQFSSAPQSMFSISQDTGISTDINTTEISSSLVSSKQELGSTADNCSSYDQRPSVVPISDIEGLWDF